MIQRFVLPTTAIVVVLSPLSIPSFAHLQKTIQQWLSDQRVKKDIEVFSQSVSFSDCHDELVSASWPKGIQYLKISVNVTVRSTNVYYIQAHVNNSFQQESCGYFGEGISSCVHQELTAGQHTLSFAFFPLRDTHLAGDGGVGWNNVSDGPYDVAVYLAGIDEIDGQSFGSLERERAIELGFLDQAATSITCTTQPYRTGDFGVTQDFYPYP
jgi:hypothetical protein